MAALTRYPNRLVDDDSTDVEEEDDDDTYAGDAGGDNSSDGGDSNIEGTVATNRMEIPLVAPDVIAASVTPPPMPVHIETLVELEERMLVDAIAYVEKRKVAVLFAKVGEQHVDILNANTGIIASATEKLLTNVEYVYHWDVTAKKFIMGREVVVNHVSGAKPVSNATPGTRTARGDTTMIVDGIIYNVASLAIHALYPETKGKAMSRSQIIIYLEKRHHKVTRRANGT